MFKRWIAHIKRLFTKLKKALIPASFILAFILFVSFAERSNKNELCNQVNIKIQSNHSNDFLNENDIKTIIKNFNNGPVEGKNMNEIDLFGLENKLNDNSFIESSEVFTDLHGNLYIDVIHRTPILRIKANNGDDYYIDIHGHKMPLSNNYTAKSLVFTGMIKDEDFRQGSRSPLFQLASYIDEDLFLKALIGQVHVDNRGEIILIPKVGNIIIEFGNAENIENKFKKLKILYKKILPAEGWDKYEKASLKFKKQIVLKQR